MKRESGSFSDRQEKNGSIMERKAQVYFAWFNVLIMLKILSESINSVSKDNLCFVLAHCAYHRIMFSSKLVLERRTAAKY